MGGKKNIRWSVKVGDLIRRSCWWPGRKHWADKRVGFIRGTCSSSYAVSKVSKNERMINIVWFDDTKCPQGEWISEYWLLDNVEIISESR